MLRLLSLPPRLELRQRHHHDIRNIYIDILFISLLIDLCDAA